MKDKQVHRVYLLLKKELVKVTIFLNVFYGLVTFMYNDVLLDSGCVAGDISCQEVRGISDLSLDTRRGVLV